MGKNEIIANNENSICKLSLKLKEITKILRSPSGCPWDKAQSISSLSEFILEEAHEAYETILKKDYSHLKEELGDILSQVFMISRIAEEQNLFTTEDVFNGIIEKLIRRHPHVFGNKKAKDEKEALSLWNKEKKIEKKERKSRIDGIPSSLPSLLYALKLQRKAAVYGFDWKEGELNDQIDKVIEKIYEEIDEIKRELAKINLKSIISNEDSEYLKKQSNNELKKDKSNDESNNKDNNYQANSLNTFIEEEIGDLFFAVINLARKVEVNPDFALRKAIKKFTKRFKYIENIIDSQKIDLNSIDEKQLENLWTQSKHLK